MKKFFPVLAFALFIVSLSIVFIRLFSPAEIQIILETGQEVASQNADYFTLSDVLLFISAAFIAGVTVTYLYICSEDSFSQRKVQKEGNYELVLPLLKEGERKIVLELAQAKGTLLQNELVQRTGLSKVKVTRVLTHLAQKGLVTKERYGMTNKVKLIEK